MKRNLALSAALLALGLAVSTPARADSVLYSQATDLSGAFASQTDTNANGLGNYSTVYDNFTLGSASTIDSLGWVGSYFGAPGPGTLSGFSLAIYADSSGAPDLADPALATWAISGNANETFIGYDQGGTPSTGNPTYSYSASISTMPFIATAGTHYWLSIVANMGFPPEWGWEASSGAGDPGDNSAYQVYLGSGSVIGSDLAFSLTGHVDLTAVPEPSTLFLGALGALCLFGYSRIQRRPIA